MTNEEITKVKIAAIIDFIDFSIARNSHIKEQLEIDFMHYVRKVLIAKGE